VNNLGDLDVGMTTVLGYVRLEVLTAMVMKSSIFLGKTPCSPLKVNRLFGETYRLHFGGRRISQARKQHTYHRFTKCSGY
jgi:hypothetical protein